MFAAKAAPTGTARVSKFEQDRHSSRLWRLENVLQQLDTFDSVMTQAGQIAAIRLIGQPLFYAGVARAATRAGGSVLVNLDAFLAAVVLEQRKYFQFSGSDRG
ncbi:hypothetical protein PPS11_37960 [Pseudomonas putida S11]|nr:hypothetical protein PPS11_37960 [Pseudomonas putida S11]